MPTTTDFDAMLNPAPLVLDEAVPVFVVGCVRSGTSAVARALREGAEISGFREGNVLSMMQRMLREVARQYEHLPEDILERKKSLMLANCEREALETHVVNWFAALYAKQLGTGRWYDKSPESYPGAPMVRACPVVVRLFPRARFIFCIRRGIEQVMSCLRKFPSTNFKAWCRVWRDAAYAWHEVKEQLGDRAIAIEQHELALRPDLVSERIQELLGLSAAHGQAMESVLRGARVEQTQFAQDSRFIGLDETPWSAEERRIFSEICGPAMEGAGFSMEGRLIEPTAPLRLFHPVKHAEKAVALHAVAPGSFRRNGEGGLVLVPNAPGEPPAEVRYLAAEFVGQDRLSGVIGSIDNGGDPLDFCLRIEPAGGGAPVVELVQHVTPGAEKSWEAGFPAIHGTHDIVISTRVASGFFRTAPGIWRDITISIAT